MITRNENKKIFLQLTQDRELATSHETFYEIGLLFLDQSIKQSSNTP